MPAGRRQLGLDRPREGREAIAQGLRVVGRKLLRLRDGVSKARPRTDEAGFEIPLERRTVLIGMERDLVAIFAGAIADLLPAIGRSKTLLKPVTMSLFGMLNWHYMWFREGGTMNREDYADLATTVLVEGAQALATPVQAAKAHRRA